MTSVVRRAARTAAAGDLFTLLSAKIGHCSLANNLAQIEFGRLLKINLLYSVPNYYCYYYYYYCSLTIKLLLNRYYLILSSKDKLTSIKRLR